MSINHGNAATRLSRQSGTTLMEVLVSLLVLSFGMLGMAGVQGVSLRGSVLQDYGDDVLGRYRRADACESGSRGCWQL